MVPRLIAALATLLGLVAGCPETRPVQLDGAGSGDGGADADAAPKHTTSWVNTISGQGSAHVHDIAVDGKGNIYATGAFGFAAPRGATASTSFGALTSTKGEGLYLAKLGSSGKFQWVLPFALDLQSYGMPQVTVDPKGQAFLIAHNFVDALKVGSCTKAAARSSWTDGHASFVASITPAGKCSWLTQSPKVQFMKAALDDKGNLLLIGFHDSGLYLTAKLRPDRTLAWITTLGSAEPWDIALDNAGNSYITGHYSDTLTLGATDLSSRGGADVFVVKVSSAGKIMWASSAGGPEGDQSTSIAVDGQGNSYIAGSFEGSASFGKHKLTARGPQDGFVARLDPKGAFSWVASAGGSNDVRGADLVLSPDGLLYFTGDIYDTVHLKTKPVTLGSITLPALDRGGLFVARLDRAGQYLWATTALSGGNGHIAADPAGAVLVGGDFDVTMSLLGKQVTARHTGDAFVWKLLVDGP